MLIKSLKSRYARTETLKLEVARVLASNVPKSQARFIAVAVVCLLLGVGIYYEAKTSVMSSLYFSSLSRSLTYRVEEGPSDTIPPAGTGPYDLALGYNRIAEFSDSMSRQGYEVSSQARLSSGHAALVKAGLFPIYLEKGRAGLITAGGDGLPLEHELYPKYGYRSLEEVPALIVASLLFIEDRQLLESKEVSTINPAISWDRLTKATIELMLDKLFLSRNVPGGSTLATQIEKFRHSYEGRTRGTSDKLRQMASATVRAYLLGSDTRAMREKIVLDYINAVPLAAVPGMGAVNGIGEAVSAWYGISLNDINKQLLFPVQSGDQFARNIQAKAFKRVLALFLAQRRPRYYLQQNQADLEVLADKYVRLMRRANLISTQLASDALEQKIDLIPAQIKRKPLEDRSFLARKGENAVKVDLAKLLGTKSFYELERLDAYAQSTIFADLQRNITEHLAHVRTEEGALKAGLIGDHMLKPGQAAQVNFSFTLMERQDNHNAVRVQTDTVDAPLDLNRGGKLELGSTAKLRTLVTYLTLVEELYLEAKNQESLQNVAVGREKSRDSLKTWVFETVKEKKAVTLAEILDLSVKREFSASPYQGFETGGGFMHFSNFDGTDNGLHLTIAQAFQRSNNLVFVRVMKEVVDHLTYRHVTDLNQILTERDHTKRAVYLDRFVEFEGQQLVRKFYKKHVTSSEIIAELIGLKPKRASQVASIILTLRRDLDLLGLSLEVRKFFPRENHKDIARFFETLKPENMSLIDRAYVGRVHPLELWVAEQLNQNSNLTLSAALASSRDARKASYEWLTVKGSLSRQNKAIMTMVERDVFAKEILPRWKAQGYPFDTMVPSLATALGSSGDRPTALAELIGALGNSGVLMPTRRVGELTIGKDTPYEISFVPAWVGAKRVISPEGAEVALAVLGKVVDGGTARRLRGSIVKSDGNEIIIRGKTGTGDNRLIEFDAQGRAVKSEAKSRTATFVFSIGERFYGTITAFVDSKSNGKPEDFTFTSALVVQTLKAAMPLLKDAVLRVEDSDALAMASSN